MIERPLIIISLEGLLRSSLGCYGCSWNRTPAIDAIAAGGTVWDRWIATHDDDRELLSGWFDASPASGTSWLKAWRDLGSTILLTDVQPSKTPDADAFDSIVNIPAERTETPADADDLAETAFGRLIATAIERDQQDEPWSVMWLHSDFLTRCWDAPRDLFPLDDVDAEEDEPEPVDSEIDGWQETEDVEAIERLPWVFDAVTPPQLPLDEDSHPDLLTTWMRTYACQVRLVDLLLEVLLQSLDTEDPWLVLLGTSGFQFGQNGWIGHRGRSLRSADIHLPLVVSDRGPLRVPQLTSSGNLPEVLSRLRNNQAACHPTDWSRLSTFDEDQAFAEDADQAAPVQTHSSRVASATTTTRWFYVRENDEQEHLFLKPDDVDDFNDVARVRKDIASALRERESS